MKTLTLLRHAKSEQDDLSVRDFDRTLNAKGRRAARAVGRHLRDGHLRFDHILASPATRVTETVAEVSSGYGETLAPQWERRIYLASPADLLELIHEAPDSASALLVVGHNPGLEQLVLLLSSQAASGPRDQVEQKFPTASLAQIEFDVAHWGEIAPGSGRLARFTRPRDIDPSLGPEMPA